MTDHRQAMRGQFPDPEQRLAASLLSTYEEPDISGAFWDCCAKQDIPEVEAVIGTLQGPLEDFWRQVMGDALDIAVERLRELEDRLPTTQVDGLVLSSTKERDEQLLIATFLDVLSDAASQPFAASLDSAIGSAARTLLEAGAASDSLTIDLDREPLALSASRSDLRTLLKGRITVRTSEITASVIEFLRSKRARTPARPGDITEAAPGFKARNLQEWLAGNVDIVGLQTQKWLPGVADQWAYRWFTAGTYLAGIQAGLTVLVAQAVIDGKTTTFCRWVNGRVISTFKAAKQLDPHLQAALKGEVQTMIQNWPMLSSEITTSESSSVLSRGFARAGLPPYHWRCRTTVRWLRR